MGKTEQTVHDTQSLANNMENIVVVLLSLVIPLLLFCLLKLKSSLHNQKPALKLPPGPWTLPVVGNIHHLLSSPLLFRTLRDLSEKYGPLMHLKIGQVSTVVVSSPEAAKEVMKTNDVFFANRHATVSVDIIAYRSTDVIFGPYNDRWRQLRKICVLELLSSTRVQTFRRVREEEIARLVQHVAATASAGDTINLTERISILANDTIMRETVGGRCKHQEECLRELDVSNKLSSGFALADLFPSLKPLSSLGTVARRAQLCHRRLHNIIQSIIRERQESAEAGGEGAGGQETFLDVLLKFQKEGGTHALLDTDTISALVFDMLAAGSDTSYTVLDWTMAELLRNPRIMEKAQAEVRHALQGKPNVTEDDLGRLNYLKVVIKESLRLHAPVPLLLPRRCGETCRVMGYDIPKGTTVLVNVWAMARDPKYWENAEEFKPERFEGRDLDFKGNNYEFLPFGAGRRMCAGMSLGVANIELALVSLLYHFDWILPDGMRADELDMIEDSGSTARRRSNLHVRAVPCILPTTA